jgi:hypothetical protein
MKDYEKQEVKAVVRHSGEKFQCKWDTLGNDMSALLTRIHDEMLEKATKSRSDHL